MASKADIEAGRAHISIYLKNSELVKGLNSLKSQLQGLGSGIMKIGGVLSGAGAAIIAPLIGAISYFSSAGDALGKMAARTGVSAGSLAELGFAAEQGGAQIEDVEKGIRKMQKTVTEAADGSQTAADALGKIGLSAAKLKGLKPEDQFQAIADGIDAIPDPTLKAATAMEIFGKSGTQLLPMLGSLREVRAEAQRRGLVPSEEAVRDAEAINDAFGRIRRTALSVVFEIGASLAPVLMPALEVVANIATATIHWVKQNGALVRTVALVGAGLVVAGGVLTAIGATIFGIGTAFGLLASAIAGVGTVLGFLLSPVTLVVAAVAAGIFVWARFTESGRAAVQGIINFFAPLLQTARDTIGGIGDALLAGNLTLAGQIAITGLRLVLLQGLEAIAAMIGGKFGDAISNVAGKLIRGDLKGAWDSAVTNMAALWDGFVSGIVSAFTDAAKVVTDIWAGITKRVTTTLLQLAIEAPSLGKAILGVDLHAEEARRKKLNEQAQKLGLATNDENVFEGANRVAKEQIDAQAASLKSSLDAVNAAMAAQAGESAAAAVADNQAGAAETSAEVQQLTAELAALRQEAAVARDKAALPQPAPLAGGLPDVSAAKASFVTFSAAALAAQGGGGPQDKMVRELREQKAIQRNQLKEQEKTRQKLDALQILATA